MIRRSPAEYYVKYLLLHPDNYGDEDIIRVLREHQLDYPGGNYLDRLRSKLRKPRVFHPMNEGHAPSFKFLVGEKVHTLFFPDSKTRAALRLLGNPRVKEMVEAMTIVNDPLSLIATRIKKAGIDNYTVSELKRYCHYFWNINLVDPTELRTLIHKRVEDIALEGDDKAASIIQRAMKRAQFTDARHMAVSTAVPLVAAMRMQVKYGYMPDRVETARLAEMACALGVGAALEAANEKGPRSSQEYANYAIGARNMRELMDLFGSVNDSVSKDLQALAIETSGEAVPHIHELTNGDYTDGLPSMQEKKNDKRS